MSARILIVILGFFSTVSYGQFSYKYDQTVPLTVPGANLNMPWAGGLNSPQYNELDLNEDGIVDLVILDRTTNKLFTFLSDGQSYNYSPEYESFFPTDVDQWMIIKDFDCDGRGDLFTNTLLGIKAYRNLGAPDGFLRWEVAADPIFTQGFSSQINIQMSAQDIPGIEDLDNDGDLDILVYDFVTGTNIEYHKNLSIENNGDCSELVYKRITKSWGNFKECICGDFIFGNQPCSPSTGKIAHPEGKSILLIDMDNDGDKDILVGQESCNAISYLENQGTPDSAIMKSFEPQFPLNTQAIDFHIFPASFSIDLNFDGIRDLMATPNVSINVQDQVDFKNSNWIYANTGNNAFPEYQLQQTDFLQNQMLDLGDHVYPTFIDFDNDLDLDMIVGIRGVFESNSYRSKLYLFENQGDLNQPSFELTNNDFLGISSLNKRLVKPQFADLDLDGLPDLVIAATEPNLNDTELLFIKNTGSFQFDLSSAQPISIDISINDNPVLYDIDKDGNVDLLLATFSGDLEYYNNLGNLNFSLIDGSFLGIEGSPLNRGLSVTVGDFNGDGNLDLASSDFRGITFLYPQIELFNESVDDPISLLLNNSISNEVTTIKSGRNSYLANADLLNNGLPYIFIGNGTGGISPFKSTADEPVVPDNFPIEISVFPNPSTSENRFINVTSNQEVTVEILNSLGQLVIEPVTLRKSGVLTINTIQMRSGIYLVNAFAGSTNNSVKRLLVIK